MERVQIDLYSRVRVYVIVLDQSGRPLPGVGVRFCRLDARDGQGIGTGTTDANGALALSIREGMYFFNANGIVATLEDYGSQHTERRIDKENAIVKIKLSRKNSALRILAICDDGPVAGLEFCINGGRRLPTGRDGSVEFMALKKGHYRISSPRIADAGFAMDLDDVRRAIELDQGESNTITYRLARRVECVVRTEPSLRDGEYLTLRASPVTCRFDCQVVDCQVTTSRIKNGTARVMLPPGLWEFTAVADAESQLVISYSEQRLLAAKAREAVTIRFNRSSEAVMVRVMDEAGTPVNRMLIAVRGASEGSHYLKTAMTSKDGECRIRGLPARALIRAAVEHHPGSFLVSRPNEREIRGGVERDVVFRVTNAATIVGAVPDGFVAATIRLAAWPRSRPTYGPGRTSYSIKGIPVGYYTVEMVLGGKIIVRNRVLRRDFDDRRVARADLKLIATRAGRK